MKMIKFIVFAVLFMLVEQVEAQNYVKIGQLYWAIQNLNTSTFSNGDEIKEAKSPEDWIELFKRSEPAYCSVNYNPKNDSLYGKVYNWFAMVDPRGLAPEGFMVPSMKEWSYLRAYINYDTICKCQLIRNSSDKLRSKSEWNGKITGQNLFGMNIEPLGYLRNDGFFEGRYNQTTFWTCSPKNAAGVIGDSYDTYYVIFNHEFPEYYMDTNFDINGHFVRCVSGKQPYYFSPQKSFQDDTEKPEGEKNDDE